MGVLQLPPALWVPGWMGAWRLGRKEGKLIVVTQVATVVIQISTVAI